ncbi:hypothetical protein GLAREA_10258 [Glarea lozoyensis ATCC 20868]|uniref:Uncharacterized protein n=1 Tax=Glarea lozoyensis (strain ATCC 20868 / MF5171) TaxID=1116229 RepID=S3DBS9_GLAL2|nr:uncharacterized protein GLAREA_10258 [Glarea lozoyensis ATCC 20868]EPE34564.1 hypothetical protein GLAREA_10258 [Glarea lozoyensis ATCC 20868]
MYSLQNIFSFLAVACLGHFALALPEPVEARVTTADVRPLPTACPSCYTYTETRSYTKTKGCPSLETCPPHPFCIIISTSTVKVPPTDKACPLTPTLVVTAPPFCPTCVTGCDTTVTTITVTGGPIQTLFSEMLSCVCNVVESVEVDKGGLAEDERSDSHLPRSPPQIEHIMVLIT